jgi:ketosteroid isomerase-like protein
MLLGLSLAAATPEGQVKEADARWRDAVIKIDIPALEQVLADNLTYTHSSGRTETKAEFIQATKSASLKYEAMDVSDVMVRVTGNTAILTMVADMKVRPAGGQTNSFRAKVLRVYVRQKDQWRLAAHQSTRMTS